MYPFCVMESGVQGMIFVTLAATFLLSEEFIEKDAAVPAVAATAIVTATPTVAVVVAVAPATATAAMAEAMCVSSKLIREGRHEVSKIHERLHRLTISQM